MSGLEHAFRPPALDLSAAHVTMWLGKLPHDYLSAFGQSVPPSDEGGLSSLSEQLAASSNRGYAEIVQRHAALVVGMGRPRRMRLLAWLTQMCWPDSDRILRALSDISVGEGEGDARGGGGGRAKTAPLFLSDLEVIAGVVSRREVRAIADRRTVESVDVGVHEFAGAFGPASQGGM